MVTIILPVYNTEPFLKKTIESVLVQSSVRGLIAIAGVAVGCAVYHWLNQNILIMILGNFIKGILVFIFCIFSLVFILDSIESFNLKGYLGWVYLSFGAFVLISVYVNYSIKKTKN